MTEAAHTPDADRDWHHAVAKLYGNKDYHALVAILGYVTQDLTPEVRQEAIAWAEEHVEAMRRLCADRPLMIQPDPPSGS